METRHAFATRIASLRKQKGLTQGELAEKLGISRQSITLYENQSRIPDIEVLRRFANFFEVSADYLIGIENNGKVEYKVIGKELGLGDKAINALRGYTESIDTHISCMIELSKMQDGFNYLFDDFDSVCTDSFINDNKDSMSEELLEKISLSKDDSNEFDLNYRNNPLLIAYAIDFALTNPIFLILLGRIYIQEYEAYPQYYKSMTTSMLTKISYMHLQELLDFQTCEIAKDPYIRYEEVLKNEKLIKSMDEHFGYERLIKIMPESEDCTNAKENKRQE